MSESNEIKILVELIKTTDKNSSDKFDNLTKRLDEHVTHNVDNFIELKSILKDQHKNLLDHQREIYDETIAPIKKRMNDHSLILHDYKQDKKDFVKKDICKLNEDKVKEHFDRLTKKVIMYNLLFAIFYIIILYNSNLVIEWKGIFEIVNIIKKFF